MGGISSWIPGIRSVMVRSLYIPKNTTTISTQWITGLRRRSMDRVFFIAMSQKIRIKHYFCCCIFLLINATMSTICFVLFVFAGTSNHAAFLCHHPFICFAISLQSIPFLFLAYHLDLSDHLHVLPICLNRTTTFGPSIFWITVNPYPASSESKWYLLISFSV